jgi:DNA primase
MNSLNIKEKERSEEGSSFFLKIVSNIYKNNLFTLKGEKVLNYLIEKRGIQFDSIESFSLGCSIGFSQITSIFFNEGNSKFRTEEILSSNIVKLTENGFRDFFVGMRLIIPVENENGEVVSFASRSIDGERVESKYLYLPGYTGYQKSSILYNYHEAKISNENECYLVEGFFDVISLTSIGKKNCVGILGTNLSEKQIRLIKRLKKRVILFLDGDKSGREATISLSVKLINEVIDFEVLHGYDGDPDEILRKKGINKLLEVIGNREDPYSHIINHYFSEMMLKDNPQRIGVFIGEIARIFQKSKFFEKKFIIEKISTLTS